MFVFLRKVGIITKVIIIAALLFVVKTTIVEARDVRIIVLKSYEAQPYNEALAGFEQYLREQKIKPHYKIYPLEGDVTKVEQTIQEIKKGKVDLIVTIGSLATDTMIKKIIDIPIVACLVLSSENLKNAFNATGVSLEFPLEIQFETLRRFLPKAKTIGVIYNPEENEKKIKEAATVARKMGLRLEGQKVSAPQDVPAALENLSRRADVIWGVPDDLVLSPQLAKHILLFSFRNNIPFVGLSSAWVKAGALYSLDWDYSDIGSQCGEIAIEIIKGVSPRNIPPASPRMVMYSLNLKTAQHMKIIISEDFIHKAKYTF
ncbi:MAG: ABC transporter substrate-binding protein [Nitrospirota bacterium]